jgi:hypothetical protein
MPGSLKYTARIDRLHLLNASDRYAHFDFDVPKYRKCFHIRFFYIFPPPIGSIVAYQVDRKPVKYLNLLGDHIRHRDERFSVLFPPSHLTIICDDGAEPYIQNVVRCDTKNMRY